MTTAKKPARRSSRKKATATKSQRRGLAWGGIAFGALAVAVGAGIALALRNRDTGEHEAPDLALDAPEPGKDGARAPVDFRPDPTAVPSKGEYDSLRPATGPAPSIASTRGEMANQTGAAG